jgi:hypothetical protein
VNRPGSVACLTEWTDLVRIVSAFGAPTLHQLPDQNREQQHCTEQQ